MTVALIGFYTITPTHCGTGQVAGAVDLPIAREGHTQHPILPATSIKGSVRDIFEQSLGAKSGKVERWFGPELDPSPGGTGGKELAAGSVIFGEGRLLAFPVRALHTAFVYVTCPLILERFHRDLEAYGLKAFWNVAGDLDPRSEKWQEQRAAIRVASSFGQVQQLVLEDLVFDNSRDRLVASEDLSVLGKMFSALLPDNEKATARRLATDLIVLPDDCFNDLVQRVTPVQARIRLNDKKTTTGDGGNLWYEEALPTDTILACFVRSRPERNGKNNQPNTADFLRELKTATNRPIQIGGNETVGQGVCLWHLAKELQDAH